MITFICYLFWLLWDVGEPIAKEFFAVLSTMELFVEMVIPLIYFSYKIFDKDKNV